jgi:hypothetical protein
MVFKERKKCTSVATSSGVTIERNEKRQIKEVSHSVWAKMLYTYCWNVLETGKCAMKFLNDKWLSVNTVAAYSKTLSMNTVAAYSKTLRSTHKDQI